MKKLLLFTILNSLLFTAYSQFLLNKTLLLETGSTSSDQFGYAVAIDGKYAVVGDYNKTFVNGNVSLRFAGVVYVYEKTAGGNWQLKQTLRPSDIVEDHSFGHSVDISGDHIVVGCGDGGELVAYDFKLNSNGLWEENQRIIAPDFGETENIGFGYSLALDNKTLIIGAPRDSDEGRYSWGSAYVFDLNAQGKWEHKVKLTSPNYNETRSSDQFGYDVSVHGNTAVIGAQLEDGVGAAYIYERDANNNWNKKARLIPSPEGTEGYFGRRVSANDSTVIIAAVSDDTLFNGKTIYPGSVFVFTKTKTGEWVKKQKFFAPDLTISRGFGSDVEISDDYLFVGDRYSNEIIGNDTLDRTGLVFVYTKGINGDWQFFQKIHAPDYSETEFFGCSISYDDGNLIVGADDYNNSGIEGGIPESGAAFIFDQNISTGLGSVAENSSLSAFPNPVEEILNIRSVEKGKGVFYNSLGIEVIICEFAPGTNSVDIGDLPAGIYTLSLKAESDKVETIRIFKR
jgi:hypothetical protein